MIKSIDDITEVEMYTTSKTFEEVLVEYWGETAIISEIGDIDETLESSITYAVYNDEIDEQAQLGSITEIYRDNEVVCLRVLREIMN